MKACAANPLLPTDFVAHCAHGLVAYAPSNVRDAAEGKSFTFITIVIRNGMGTLVRAASALMPTFRGLQATFQAALGCVYAAGRC